ncbi:hypothetical protein Q1695_002792 [Nippostrongylus brasiliensis]|nr:hypothetical protein Q1695_002792 [Nippostrongylus brasiliensis]
MSKDIDRCRTECQKASNNAVLHEIKDSMGRFTKFRTEIEERLKAVEEKQEVLPKVLAAVEEIKSLLSTGKSDQIEEPTIEKEAKSPDSYDDRRILDEPAAVNRSLKKTRNGIFVLNHKLEEEKKNGSQRHSGG